MRRNGFYPPSGEVMVSNALTSTHEGAPVGASTIVDVAIGDEKTWTLLDQKRSRVFTYDKNGNLLFAFGDKGTQMGNLQRAVAVAYQGSAMLILDGETNTITVYHRTEYGDVLINALADTNAREYDKAVEGWRNILMRNNNFDAAYVGIGDALYREGKWEEAMENYKVAYDTDSYSNAFRQYRKDLVADWILLVVAVIVVFFVLLALFLPVCRKGEQAHCAEGREEDLLGGGHLRLPSDAAPLRRLLGSEAREARLDPGGTVLAAVLHPFLLLSGDRKSLPFQSERRL